MSVDLSVLESKPISAWAYPKVVMYVPMLAGLPYADDVFYNFLAIVQQGVDFFAMPYSRIDVARNMAGQALLDSQFTHLLMLDSDHPHPIDIIQRLAKRVLENPNRLVVAAMAFRRGAPYDPQAWVKKGDSFYTVHEWEAGAIVEVDTVGTPAILIHRDVFAQVGRPWFFYDYTYANSPDFSWPTEDVGFCRKVREAGIKIYCDTSVVSPHMRSVRVDERTYRTWCEVHPESDIDPVIEKKAYSIAEWIGITPEELEERVNLGSRTVREKWNELHPNEIQGVEGFYGLEDNGYFYDLLAWNKSAMYKGIVKGLEAKGKDVLVIGPGIGGEIDALLGRDNRIMTLDVPGDLYDWLCVYYAGEIEVVNALNLYHRPEVFRADLVVAVDVIEHIHPERLTTILDVVQGVLRPGGELYCHNNFGEVDLYPMHYPENGVVFDEWVKKHFRQIGGYAYERISEEVPG